MEEIGGEEERKGNKRTGKKERVRDAKGVRGGNRGGEGEREDGKKVGE